MNIQAACVLHMHIPKALNSLNADASKQSGGMRGGGNAADICHCDNTS